MSSHRSPRPDRSTFDPIYYDSPVCVWEPPSRSSSLQAQPAPMAVPALLSSNPARASVDSSPRSSTNSTATIGMGQTKSTLASSPSESLASFPIQPPVLLNQQPFDQQLWVDYQQKPVRKISANHEKVRKFDQDRERVLEARRLYNLRLAEQAKEEERMKLEIEKAKANAKAQEQAKVQAAVKQKSEDERRTHANAYAPGGATQGRVPDVDYLPRSRSIDFGSRRLSANGRPYRSFPARTCSISRHNTSDSAKNGNGNGNSHQHFQRDPPSPQSHSFRDSDTVRALSVVDSPAPSTASSLHSDYADKTPDAIVDQEYIQTAMSNQSSIARYKSVSRKKAVAVQEHERLRLLEARRLYNMQVAELQRHKASLSDDGAGGVLRSSVDVYVGPGGLAGVDVRGAQQHLSTTATPAGNKIQDKFRSLFKFLGRREQREQV
ncbi:hypothetical protein HDU82_002333 [Entophlyctis luteolus]|nr:hypothetical protein HDU82_002333 [Entophlyctis luteolus]